MSMHFRKMNKLLAALLVLAMLLCSMPAALAQSVSAFARTGAVAVYSDAGLSAKVGAINQFSVVTVTAAANGVAQLNVNGMTVYTKASELTLVEEVAIKAVVNTSARVYQYPSTSGSYANVPKGTEVNVLAVNGGWALIEKNGIGGYTSVSALTPAAVQSTPQPTAAPTQAPSTENAIPALIAADSVKVYASASTGGQYLGTLYKGTQVNVLNISGSWAWIELAGNYGYCAVSALVPVGWEPAATPAPTQAPSVENAIPAVVSTESVKVYASADTDSKLMGTLYKGTQLNVLNISGSWALVELGGYYGFCAVSALIPAAMVTPEPTAEPTLAPTAANAIPAVVSADSVKIYAAADTDSKVMGTLYKGMQLNVLNISGSWALVELGGYYGFCAVSALIPAAMVTPAPTATPEPTSEPAEISLIPAKVVSASLDVYARNSTSSNRIAVLQRDARVNVVAIHAGWALIERDGNYGFCLVSGLSPVTDDGSKPAPTKSPSAQNAIPGIVTVNNLKVYERANVASTCLGTLAAGAQVNVLAVSDGWAYIELAGNYGYCVVYALTPLAALPTATPTPGPTDGYRVETFVATVVVGDAKLYSSASTSAASTGVPLGANVTVGAYNAQWAYVNANGTKGFMLISALSRTEYSALSKGSTGSSVSTLEKALLSLGYLDEQPDSTFNSSTESAVKLLQSACGLQQTGTADAALQRVLYSGNAPASPLLSASFSKGSAGSDVARIQYRLLALGYLSKTSSVDGDYGNTTLNAVKLFQNCNGLNPSGTADSTTLRRLYSTGAAALPSGRSPADVAVIINPTPGSQKNNSTEISPTLASVTSEYNAGMSAAEKLEYAIYVGQNQLGKPYIYGANGPTSYDCSGFTCYCFKQIGVTLPRTAVNQGYNNAYDRIDDISELKRGDLVYFNTVSDNDLSDHAGIYLGAGYFIHASSGQSKVVVSNLVSGYYNGVFSWGHRVLAN